MGNRCRSVRGISRKFKCQISTRGRKNSRIHQATPRTARKGTSEIALCRVFTARNGEKNTGILPICLERKEDKNKNVGLECIRAQTAQIKSLYLVALLLLPVPVLPLLLLLVLNQGVLQRANKESVHFPLTDIEILFFFQSTSSSLTSFSSLTPSFGLRFLRINLKMFFVVVIVSNRFTLCLISPPCAPPHQRRHCQEQDRRDREHLPPLHPCRLRHNPGLLVGPGHHAAAAATRAGLMFKTHDLTQEKAKYVCLLKFTGTIPTPAALFRRTCSNGNGGGAMVDVGCWKRSEKGQILRWQTILPRGWEKSCLFLMPRHFNNNMAEIDDCDFFFALARSHLSRFPSFFQSEVLFPSSQRCFKAPFYGS